MKKRYIASFLIGGICLYLAFRKVEWAQIAKAFSGADYAFIPLLAAAQLSGIWIRAARWRLILEPVGKASVRNLASAISIGFMANFLFPARAGELARAWLIGRREGMSKSSSFATVVLERLFDGYAILLFMALFPFFLSVPPGKEGIMGRIKYAALVALCAYTLILAVLLLFQRRRDLFLRGIDWACRPLPPGPAGRIRALACSFGGGLDMLGSPAHILGVAAWSVFLWTVIGLGNWAILLAFGIDLPLFAGLFLVVVQSFGVMVPSPGFVGAFQYAHVLGLSLFGVGQELALSVGMLIHAVLFVVIMGMGLIFLWKEGLTFGQIAEAPAGNER